MKQMSLIEQLFHEILEYSMFGLGLLVFILLYFIKARYGRYTTDKWGPQINPKLGWIIMESIAPILFFIYFITSPQTDNCVAWVFVGIWELHYIQRAFIYPFLLRSQNQMPIVIMVMAMVFNLANSYLQGRYLFVIRNPLPIRWLWDIRFILGTTIFITGYSINIHSDYILRHLREPGEKEYKIPHGGLFRYVSCPNYFGEFVEWIGWAILTWSLTGLLFAFWTGGNLIPRAKSHHQWYQEHFANYPENRKAIIPKLY